MVSEFAKRFIWRRAKSAGFVVARATQLHTEIEVLNVGRFLEHYGIDLVIDVGANAGQYARMLRERVGYTGRILSCEPNPGMTEPLHKVSNGDDKWKILPVAIGEKPGTAVLNVYANSEFSSISELNKAESKIFADYTQLERKVEVEVTTVDALIRQHATAADAGAIYLKVDTQGLEKSVVLGAKESMHLIAGLQLELAFKKLYENSWRFLDAVPELQAMGFALSALFPNNRAPFPELIETDAIFRNESLPATGRSSSAPASAVNRSLHRSR